MKAAWLVMTAPGHSGLWWFTFSFDGKQKCVRWDGRRARAAFLTGLLMVQGFSLCFILSNVSTVYMCFADKKRKMNWQTLSQTRQESTVWTKWKLDCFPGWSQHWCSKLSDHVMVLGADTQHWKEEESKADLREPGKLKEKWKAFIWEGTLAGDRLSGHFEREGTTALITVAEGHLLIGTIPKCFPIFQLGFTAASTPWNKNPLTSSQPLPTTCGWRWKSWTLSTTWKTTRSQAKLTFTNWRTTKPVGGFHNTTQRQRRAVCKLPYHERYFTSVARPVANKPLNESLP